MGPYSNTFLGHFWTFQNFDQIWTLDPLFITEILQEIQEALKLLLENTIFTYQNFVNTEIQNVGNYGTHFPEML